MTTIEFRFQSVIIEPADLQENSPKIFSALQQYLPVQKTQKRRRTKKIRETVANKIDAIIEDIDRMK